MKRPHRHMVAMPALPGEFHILASDKERPLATESTTNTTTIIARADQHDIDLHKASDPGELRFHQGTHRCALPAGHETNSFDWLIGNERWKARVEEGRKERH